MAQARYAEAEPLYERALSIRERVYGPNHRVVGTVLNNQALLYQDQGRHADAEPRFQRALANRRQALGGEHPEIAATMDALATSYRLQGRYDEAAPLYQQALANREKALGPDDPAVAASLNNIAGLYQSQERFADVEALYKRALAITEKALGAGHPRVADILCNWGAFLKSEGRFDDALPVLERALAASEKALGAGHPQTSRAMIQLAELYGQQGRTADAETLFLRAGASGSANTKEFQVFFGTNRKPDARPKSVGMFGTDRGDELRVGAVTVLVPAAATSADVRAGARENDRPVSNVRQLTIRSTEIQSADKVVRAARARMLRSRKYPGQVLVFVHGFNTSFDSAVRRAGQLGYDLDFDGPVFAYSWPSREKLLAYLADRESAQNSSEPLRQFLETIVAETKARRIHIIAHSMGNYAMNEAFRTMEPEQLRKLNLGEIVLASPDLDADQFQRTIRRLQPRGATSTIYAASTDRALTISSFLRDHKPQLGFIPKGGPGALPTGADFIDVTAVNSEIFSLNHDIYANSPDIIKDLGRILRNGQRPPEARSQLLEKLPTSGGGTYWRHRQSGAAR